MPNAKKAGSKEKVPAPPTAISQIPSFRSVSSALIRGYLSESKTVAEFRNGGFPYAYLVPPDQPQNTRCTLESRHYTTLCRGGFAVGTSIANLPAGIQVNCLRIRAGHKRRNR